MTFDETRKDIKIWPWEELFCDGWIYSGKIMKHFVDANRIDERTPDEVDLYIKSLSDDFSWKELDCFKEVGTRLFRGFQKRSWVRLFFVERDRSCDKTICMRKSAFDLWFQKYKEIRKTYAKEPDSDGRPTLDEYMEGRSGCDGE